VNEAMKWRAAAKEAAAKVLGEELGRAEREGEERIRQRVLGIPDSKRYMHSVGQATVEVIEAAAVEEAIRVREP
jgi:hypothetical protein